MPAVEDGAGRAARRHARRDRVAVRGALEEELLLDVVVGPLERRQLRGSAQERVVVRRIPGGAFAGIGPVTVGLGTAPARGGPYSMQPRTIDTTASAVREEVRMPWSMRGSRIGSSTFPSFEVAEGAEMLGDVGLVLARPPAGGRDGRLVERRRGPDRMRGKEIRP